MVQTKTGWRKGGSDKEGQIVPYIFGQKSLLHKGIKIVVQQGNDKGELIVHPQRAKEPKITRVELLDANYKPIPKGKKLSYKDTIIARAYCVEMFEMNIAFTLWEDDAQGEGHNPTINALNKINPVPVLSRVNEKGMAEAVFRLPFYTMAVLIANARTASGDKSEGPTHEYYVTADVVSKHIQKASPNINIVNPTHNPEPPRKREAPKGHTPSPAKPKTSPAPEKPKPQTNSSKFPVTTGGKKSDDPQGKILSAEFVDNNGNRLHSSKVGTTVRIKIVAKEMKDKKVKVKIWEEDNFTWTHDMIFEKDCILIGDNNYINNVQLTKQMFDKAKDGGSDSARQDYFIEVIHNDTSVTSAVMPVSADAKPTEVESGNSPVMVKEPKLEKKKEETVCECEARVRAFIRMLRVKEGTENEIGYTTQYSGKQFSDFSEHPQEVVTDSKGKHRSSAAGSYQIMTDTWKNLKGYYQDKNKKWNYSGKLDYAKRYNISSFDQESQDKFCLVIMKHNYVDDRADSFYNPTVWKDKKNKIHDIAQEQKLKEWRKRFKKQQGDIIQMIIDNDIKRAALISSLCWASLPDSPYGQQSSTYTFDMVKAIYEEKLAQELIEPNKELHLKKGFLKEFGYGCCGDNIKKEELLPSKCPNDCSQCFEYSDVVPTPKVNDQSGNKNHNRYKKEYRIKSNGKKYYHTGTDILAAVGTEVHSMMCGEVVHIRTDLPQNDYVKGYESPTSYGNTITIRSKDKTGKIVYHFYAHLSKVKVSVGEKIKHNQIIGLSGSTGNAMHVEVKHRHIHVEAGTSYSTIGGSDNKQRCKLNADLNPENYMKSKFDNKGNTL
ncbi:peptidoglycan DD-metalloendopeptidase family protein [Chryseobacterium jejuense]|uniref:peptidoglycan DD-metalloendopeptidase family protein n=1 Tax=Chryseobacterium jejuense TaxID=445960 RepID=UPI001AE3FF9F|nr:peptidoglycan DD-metalloendopeptidase family protein [Chryseobacterium jejuense]MBP2615844.1 muramidase (phage lysozyme) [Chryseobacterium jejuense]